MPKYTPLKSYKANGQSASAVLFVCSKTQSRFFR